MNGGTVLMIAQEVIEAARKAGFIAPDGTFPKQTLEAELAFVAAVEDVLKAHGVPVQDKVDKIIKALPLIAGLLS